MLARTGHAGVPESYFHRPSVSEWLTDLNLIPSAFPSKLNALEAALEAARNAGRGDGNLCGIRLQHDSLGYLMAQLSLLFPDAPNDASRIEAAFGPTRFIYLTRADKLAQAISHERAAQSGLWHRNADGSVYERLTPEGPVGYDFDQIALRMAEAKARDEAWRIWFSDERIDPLVLAYDDLSTDPRAALQRVLIYLGLDPALAQSTAPPLAKLADDQSRDWAARFAAETKIRGTE
jgi:LPS sulfotransferase NodH